MPDRVAKPLAAIADDLFLTPGIDGIEYAGKFFTCRCAVDDPKGYVFAEHPESIGIVLSNDQIWSGLRLGRIRFRVPSEASLPAKVQQSLRRSLGAYNRGERRNIVTRLRFVLAIDVRSATGPLPRTMAVWQPICDEVAARHDYDAPHWSSVYRWYLLYLKAGRDPCALAGLVRNRGNRERKLSDIQLKALDTALPVFLRRDRPKYATAQSAVNAELVDLHGGRTEGIDFVGYQAVRNDLRRLGREVRLHFRNGPDAARQEMSPVYAGPFVDLPFQRVEADFKYLGLFVVDDKTGLPLGTPFLMAAIDCFSGAVAGYDIGFDPPSTASASRCLQHVICRKTFDHYLKDQDGNCVVKHAWPINGVPQQFVLDNDQAFHAESFKMAAKVLGCDLKFLVPGEPSMKGTIESLWRTVQGSYLDMFPGKRLRIWNRPGNDYKPQDVAVVTLKELHSFLGKAFVDVHNQTMDEKSKERRIDRWTNAVKVHRPRPIRAHEHLIELVGAYKKLTADRKGIRMHGLAYNSDQLALYRSNLPKDAKVEVRFTPDDISQVWIMDPERGFSLAVPSTFPEYTDGLSLHQHRVNRRQAINRGVEGKIYRHDLLEAKAALYALGATMLKDKGSRRGRQHIARYFGMSPETVARVANHPFDPTTSRGTPLAADKLVTQDDDEFSDVDGAGDQRYVGEAEASIVVEAKIEPSDQAPTGVPPGKQRRSATKADAVEQSPSGAPAMPTDVASDAQRLTSDDRPRPKLKVIHVKPRKR